MHSYSKFSFSENFEVPTPQKLSKLDFLLILFQTKPNQKPLLSNALKLILVKNVIEIEKEKLRIDITW